MTWEDNNSFMNPNTSSTPTTQLSLPTSVDELVVSNRYFKFQTTVPYNSNNFQYFRFERSNSGISSTGLTNMDNLYPRGLSSSNGTWARLSGSNGTNKYHYKIIEVDAQGNDVSQLSTGNSNTYQAPDWSLNEYRGTSGSGLINTAHGEFNPVSGSSDWITSIVKNPNNNEWYFVLALVYSVHGTITHNYTDHISQQGNLFSGDHSVVHVRNDTTNSTWKVFETLEKSS